MDLNINKHRVLKLKQLAKNVKLLYVENKQILREKVAHFCRQFCDNVYVAADGEDGLEIFEKEHPSIVITDLDISHIDGLSLAKQIHKIAPQTKVIVTSVSDQRELLYDAIEAGVYRFLKKPLYIETFTKTLEEVLSELKTLEEQKIFDFYMQTIFNSQHNLLILYHKHNPIIVNESFLNFFKVKNLEEFKHTYGAIEEHFLPHNNFLYNNDKKNSFDVALENLNKLYHVKILSTNQKFHHFIFRMTKIENKEYYLASFDDITDLNLLRLFDEKQTELEEENVNQETFINLLQSIQRNHEELKLFNLYKGLSVTDKGTIVNADENRISIKASYLQQRCADYEGKIILSHSLFPADILCKSIKYINYENQTIVVDDLKFLTSSPTQWRSIRLVPEEEHKITLFYEDHKFSEQIKILNISVDAVRIEMLSFPVGFKVEEKVFVDMVFVPEKNHPLIINSEGQVLYIIERKNSFEVVIKLEPSITIKKSLIGYLSKRQITLIREFKGLQYGK